MTDCNDKNCPTHGTLAIKGREFFGSVTSAKMNKSATVRWERRIYVPKYERYQKRFSKVKVHNPPCIGAQVGDNVKIKGCRPLSKTKHFVIIQKGSEKEQ